MKSTLSRLECNDLLDRAFPPLGLCAFCAVQDGRHRVIDEIRERRKAGESVASLAMDFDVSPAVICAVCEAV